MKHISAVVPVPKVTDLADRGIDAEGRNREPAPQRAVMQGTRGNGNLRFVRPPRSMKPLFWNVDLDAVDVDRDVDFVLTRVLERGKMADVHWVIRRYGLDRIHRFSARHPAPS